MNRCEGGWMDARVDEWMDRWINTRQRGVDVLRDLFCQFQILMVWSSELEMIQGSS